ncbi:hypothetical protein JCM10213_003881 [Rhodosporidiobolus nylandii]
MPSLLRLLPLAAVASTALAHLEIHYPTSVWTTTEDQQEEGGVCGGGTRGASVAWGTEGAFVSLSGDEGQTVRVLLASSNSSSENTTISDASSFPITLSEGAAFSSSGNLCLPLNLPTNYVPGSKATLYVEATGDDETVNLVPANTSAALVIDHGSPVVNPETGGNYTHYEFYCSNGTVPALDTCSCHCDGDHEHCDDSCPDERVQAAAQECAAGASGSSLASSTSSGQPTASGSNGAAAETGSSNAAGQTEIAGAAAAMLALVGAVALL